MEESHKLKEFSDIFGIPFKFYKNTQNGNTAILFKFNLKDIDKFRKVLKQLGAKVSYNQIDSEKSRASALKNAQKLIDSGSISYYLDTENGIPFSELPEKAQMKLKNYGWSKWSKWTAEKWIAKDGWEPDEVYWFSITKNNTYTYQLILKEDDWVSFMPYDMYENQAFDNVGNKFIDGKLPIPNFDDYEELFI